VVPPALSGREEINQLRRLESSHRGSGSMEVICLLRGKYGYKLGSQRQEEILCRFERGLGPKEVLHLRFLMGGK